VGLKEALFSQKYRLSSWNAVVIAIFQQFCGISGILLFQTKIFLKMQEAGQFNIPVIYAI